MSVRDLRYALEQIRMAESSLGPGGRQLEPFQRMTAARDFLGRSRDALERCLGEAALEKRDDGGMRTALEGMLNLYVELAASGDAGSWDAEKVPQVINARAALAKGE